MSNATVITVTQRLVRLLRLPLREQLTTIHAAGALVVVEALLRRVRLPRLAELLGVSLEVTPRTGGDAGAVGRAETRPPRSQQDTTEAVGRAVRSTRRVLRAWPFGNGPCLRESLVLGHLLRHRSPLLRIGIASTGDGLLAHAWLEIDGDALGEHAGFTTFNVPADSPVP